MACALITKWLPHLSGAHRRGVIRCDNGPKHRSETLRSRAERQRIRRLCIPSGKPTQNACVERLDRTVRHEWLDLHLFESAEQAQALATRWLWAYNDERPDTAIGGVPPCSLPLTA